MKKAGCGKQLLGALLLLGIAIYGINSCFDNMEQSQKAEEARRDSMTPAQKAEEDQAAAEEAAKREREVEVEDRETQAVSFSKQCVRKYLKYPDDANFGFWDVPDVKFNEQHDGFFCSGKVKAKNTFGAELTSRWGTIVVFKDGAWQLAQLVIDDEQMYESQELTAWLASRKAATDSAGQTKADEADLERQLTESTEAKAKAELDLESAMQRVAEAQQAAAAILRDDAAYSVARKAAEQAESRVKQLRADDPSGDLASASGQWIEAKSKVQAIVNRASDEAGLTAAQLALDKSKGRANAINVRLAELKKAIPQYATDAANDEPNGAPQPQEFNGVKYVVEYEKPTTSNPVGQVFVAFSENQDDQTLDAILRHTLEQQVASDPTTGLVSSAWLHVAGTDHNQDNEMGDSGKYLIYDAKSKKIMTMNEYQGVRSTTTDKKDYFVETESDSTAEGITPERKWLTVTLVYSGPPTIEAAYDAAIKEAEIASQKGLDVDVDVSVGKKDDHANWKQLRDTDGHYVVVNYHADSKAITNLAGDKVLKTLN